jgi:carbamoyl-phosphate synthase large subunit
MAKLATRIMLGEKLKDLKIRKETHLEHFSIKEAVLPFRRFPGADAVLGPEMKSTGEVMGIDSSFGVAFAKSQMSSNTTFPTEGIAFISVNNRDKRSAIQLARALEDLGFHILATSGTADVLDKNGIKVERVRKVGEEGENVLDLIRSGHIDLVINTPLGKGARGDGYHIRSEATMSGVPCITTMSAAFTLVQGIWALKDSGVEVRSIQEYHADIKSGVREEEAG